MSLNTLLRRGPLSVCLSATLLSLAPGFAQAPGFSPAPQSAQAAPGILGQPATDIKGIDATGAPFALASLKGKVILLDVSTAWCFYCKQDAPSLQYLYKTYGPKGLAVVTCLTEDANGAAVTLAGLRAWVSTYGLTQTVMNDASGTANGVAENAYVRVTGGFPTLVLIDKSFKVQYIQGGLDMAEVIGRINGLLGQKG